MTGGIRLIFSSYSSACVSHLGYTEIMFCKGSCLLERMGTILLVAIFFLPAGICLQRASIVTRLSNKKRWYTNDTLWVFFWTSALSVSYLYALESWMPNPHRTTLKEHYWSCKVKLSNAWIKVAYVTLMWLPWLCTIFLQKISALPSATSGLALHHAHVPVQFSNQVSISGQSMALHPNNQYSFPPSLVSLQAQTPSHNLLPCPNKSSSCPFSI